MMYVLMFLLIISLVLVTIVTADRIDVSETPTDFTTDQLYKTLMFRIDQLQAKLESCDRQHQVDIVNLRQEYKAEVAHLRHEHRKETAQLRHGYETGLRSLRQDLIRNRKWIKQQNATLKTHNRKIHALQNLQQNAMAPVEQRLSEEISIHVQHTLANHSNPVPEMTSQQAPSRKRIRRVENEIEVAFFATLSHNVDHIGVNQPIVFDNAVTNIGNSYNPHFGTFVAPVPGTYVFSVTLMTLVSDLAHYGVYRNLNLITKMEIHGNIVPYDTVSNNVILHLNKGDDVSIKHIDSDHGLGGGSYTMFSGFLLSQDFSGSSPAVVGK